MAILPINPAPLINCRMHYALMLSIITKMDNHEPWLYSNFANLQCNKEGYQGNLNNDLRFCKSDNPAYYTSIIDLEIVKAPTFQKLNCSLLDVLRQAIAANKYVYMFANKYYIPSTPFYQESSMTQDLLVYGVDEDNELFYILCYDKNKLLSSIPVSFENMELAIQHSHYEFWNETMSFIQCPDESFAFRARSNEVDIRQLLNDLVDYMESTCRSEVVRQTINAELYDFGISTYDTFKRWIADEYVRYKDFDPLIGLTTIWEHKKLMHARVRYLHHLQLIDMPSSLLEEFEQLEIKALGLRNLAIKMKYHNRLDFEQFYAKMDEVRDAEVAILPELIHRLEMKLAGHIEQTV
ncbi:hypothetical protein PaecuDRAFT_0008 [Paenibacillus curdlanolyticus YK9]|uniref:Butirosin biosynthesis protein H N-terminal domain-containing protein n=1 Tax=Paenibacillus curdlanolyticus YK9 TaxID=717606 RepID=E0I4G6_9BACL|nr:hypothetical protein [Paenibacillus curdlanolyticus]EFM12497.1 hypothetical protein PaecuDRAFT_0008 [Paenibacillus curdlanolyticus YK9]